MPAARKALLSLAWLAAAALALPLSAKPHGIGEIQKDFPNSKTVGHNVCLVIDGTHVAVFGTGEDAVVGVLAYPNPPKDPGLLEKLGQAMELENTEIKYFGDKKHPAAFMLCRDVADRFAHAKGGAFGETLGESLAYVAAGGGFTPDKVTEDAFVWKMSGANMQVAFPMTDGKVQVLEAIGAAARSMNSHKAEKLAEKLGMDSGGKEIDRNTSKMIAKFLGCDAIFYSNRSMDKDFWKDFHDNKQNKGGKDKKINMSVVRTESKRILLGDEEILRKDDPGRSDFDDFWPTEDSTWPGALAVADTPKAEKGEEVQKPRKPKPVAVVEKEDAVQEHAVAEKAAELTPAQAMDAYLKYLQGL